MGQNDNAIIILALLGVGYLVLKSRKVTEAITEYRESERPWIMYSPLYLPSQPWRPIPGPAYRGPPLDDGDFEEEPSPGIPGPAYRERRRRNGFFRVPTGPSGPLVDKIRDVWTASTRGTPIPGPASQPRWPIKIGPRRVMPPMAPGLEAQLRGGAHGRIPPAPETSSFAGGEQQE